MTEQINIQTESATAVPLKRFQPYRPSAMFRQRDQFDDFPNVVTVPLINNGVPVFVSWWPQNIGGPQTYLDANAFMTIDNDIGGNTALHGIKLNHLGIYWVCGYFQKNRRFADLRVSYLEALMVGPSLEDQASLSAGAAADTLYNQADTGTTLSVQGFAVVTDLTADNNIYLTVMARCDTVDSLVSVQLEVTYMGLLDIPTKGK